MIQSAHLPWQAGFSLQTGYHGGEGNLEQVEQLNVGEGVEDDDGRRIGLIAVLGHQWLRVLGEGLMLPVAAATAPQQPCQQAPLALLLVK